MNVKPSTLLVEDDYGLVMEIKPIDAKTSVKKAVEETEYYFSKYRILTAYARKNDIDQHKEDLHIPRSLTKTHAPTLAKMLSTDQRIYIIKEHLPEEFGMNDFIDYVVKTHNYSHNDAKKMWKLTQSFLTKRKDMQVVNPGVQKTEYRYKYIGTIPEEIRNKIKALENGGKVELSN